jgi:RNA polymerase sigma factor (sigma-70 family)
MSASDTSTTWSRPAASGGCESVHHEAFVTTHWSVVLAAGARDPKRARTALTTLCQTYWYPLYAYIRHRGHGPEDAQDLTQDFFMRLLETNALASIRREGGKFRSYLLTALNHFLVDEWRRAHARKRGAGRVFSLEVQGAETRFSREPAHGETPEKLFERNWALALLRSVYDRLCREYQRTGKGPMFAELKFCLTGERSSIPYAELGSRLQVSESAVKVSVHRLRRRFRELLREEVAHTVGREEEVEEELRNLLAALAG